MTRVRSYCCFAMATTTLMACSGRQSQTASGSQTATANPDTSWTDPAHHTSAFVTVNGIRMNYLDWGGTGPTLILIHGYQDNPHVFDDLAPAFTDHFHVIAYARRGHGDTEWKEPSSMATLTEDLRTLMDSLHIAKADIAGWSMGGNEVTMMAGVHPDRVRHIVYLEGAYDWGDPQLAKGFQSIPVDLGTPKDALTSLGTFRAYERATAFPALDDMSRVEAYIRDLVVIHPDGQLTTRMGDSANAALGKSVFTWRRDYTKVHAPALAIYAQSMFDAQHGDSARRTRIAAWEHSYMAPFRSASIARVKRELPGIQIINVSGTHMSFIFESRDQIVTAMRRFLGDSAGSHAVASKQ